MKRPFDFVDGQPVDLTDPDHVLEVRKRNARLEQAVKHGLDAIHVNMRAKVSFVLDCLKCGSTVYESQYFNLLHLIADTPNPLDRTILTCACCETRYIYRANYLFEVITNIPPPN